MELAKKELERLVAVLSYRVVSNIESVLDIYGTSKLVNTYNDIADSLESDINDLKILVNLTRALGVSN